MRHGVCLITCSFNTPDVTLTMLRSYVHHHGPGPHALVLMENSTNEETARALHESDVPYVRGPGSPHSPSVHRALQLCNTTRALLVDTDIVFHRSAASALRAFDRHDLSLMGSVCGDRGGYRLHARVHPWFCVINVEHVRHHDIGFHDDARIRATASDGFYRNVPIADSVPDDVKRYDVGATFYEDIDAAGLRIGHADMEPDFFTHYEGMSWYGATNDDTFLKLADEKTRAFQRDFMTYRDVDITGAFVWGGCRLHAPDVLDRAA